MSRVIRLTEQDLSKLIGMVINEDYKSIFSMKTKLYDDLEKTLNDLSSKYDDEPSLMLIKELKDKVSYHRREASKEALANKIFQSSKESNDGILSVTFKSFNDNWDSVLSAMKGKPFRIIDGLDLMNKNITSLGNLKSVSGHMHIGNARIDDETLGKLTSVDGSFTIEYTTVKSLGDLRSVRGRLSIGRSGITSLGKLESVGRDLDLKESKVEDLGNLKIVGGDFNLKGTPLSKKYSEKQIRDIVDVKGKIRI